MAQMHTIRPATLKPGRTVADPGSSAIHPKESQLPETAHHGLIRGRALIFWDPKLPGTKFGRKLDAIDTDQITPAADCVSESLDTLDERWKAGAFRYLMPDFRARVHRGETFVIAGDRFAIGSSREMSPAGLKGIADEAGLDLVIICGQNMGDIFRRNALNLGLHVVQSPEAVADAQRRRRVHARPGVAPHPERHPGKNLRPDSADAEGRRDPPGRRHLRGGPPRVPCLCRTAARDRVP